MKSYSSREIIKLLEADCWFEVGCVGDHHQFKHHEKAEKITVTHPVKDVPIGTAKAIAKQAGIVLS